MHQSSFRNHRLELKGVFDILKTRWGMDLGSAVRDHT